MAFDDVCHVSRAAGADFQVVSVEDLVEFVRPWEMLIKPAVRRISRHSSQHFG